MNRSDRWARRLLRLCLLSWPSSDRRRVDESMIHAFEDARDAERGGLLWVLGECGSVARSGLRLRWSRFAFSPSLLALVPTGAHWGAAWKQVRRAPAFATATVVTLGAAMGTGAAVFGLVQGVFLRPPAYESPGDLVFLWNTDDETGARLRPSGPDIAAIRDRTEAFASVAFINGVTDGSFARSYGPVGHVRVGTATPNLFRTLGVHPALGRSLDTDATASGSALGADRVVISHGLWQSALGGASDPVGATVQLNGGPVTIEGVLPPDFRLVLPPNVGVPLPVDVWVPLDQPLETLRRADGRQADRDSDNSGVAVARLASGAALSRAQADVQAVWERLEVETGTEGVGVAVRPVHDDATAHTRGLFRALLAGVCLLFLIACLNVSTLVLARGLQRRSEFSVRRALGAHTRLLLRQLSAETGVLVLMAGVTGAAVAAASAKSLAAWAPAEITGLASWGWDPAGLVGAGAVAAVLLFGFGAAPLVRIGPRDVDAGRLKRGGGTGGARRALVLCEVAASVVLVLAAGLLFRTALELRAVRPGFDPEGALTFSVSLRAPDRFQGPGDRARLVRDVNDALANLGGVTASGIIVGLPLGGERWSRPWGRRGTTPDEWGKDRADFRAVSSGYFEAMGVRLRAGRVFSSDEDVTEGRRVAVVDLSLAGALAPGEEALGRSITFPLDGRVVEAEIVGIVEHVRHHDLGVDGAPTIYVPYRQEASRDLSFVLRTDGDVSRLAAPVRALLHDIDPTVPVHGLAPLRDTVERALAPTRFALMLMVLFAAFGVLASAAGLYGVLAFDVSRRKGEIGLRMALGASAGAVQRHTLSNGLRFASAGVVVGMSVAWLLAPELEPLLFGVGPRDVGTWIGAVLIVVGVALLASWLPSRRASRMSPARVLAES